LIWKKFEKVPIGQPYWVEVRGYKGWHDPLLEFGQTGQYEGFTSRWTYGYTTAEEAFNTAESACYYYPKEPPESYWCNEWRRLKRMNWCPKHRKFNCPCGG